MDFFQVAVKEKKNGGLEAYPDFIVDRTTDLMVRSKGFYAVWDEKTGLWSRDEYEVRRLVDEALHEYQKKNPDVASLRTMRSFDSGRQSSFRKYMREIGDNHHPLDESLTFLTTKVNKKDYVSKRLPYDLIPGDISAWDEIIGTLYEPDQRAKIEWFIGAIVSGEAKHIQKFVVLYGPPGAGKGTIINIVSDLFPGYTTTFDAKSLGSSGNQFAAAAFENNPLVAIQHDGDLSRIEDNTLLNSIVSHEFLKINQKFLPAYDARINAALLMGTNKAVKITDAQSGLIRRLIDVHPSGKKLIPSRYHQLMARIPFELGAIAHHCLQVFTKMKKNYYGDYQPKEMMFKTNAFFNFIEANYDIFEKQDGVTAKQAWNLYKEYCDEAGIDKPMQMHQFRSELGNYFGTFHDRLILDGVQVRSYYSDFKAEPFKQPVDSDLSKFVLKMDQTTSLLNRELEDCPAQYAKSDGTPSKYWDDSERLIGGTLKQPRPDQVVSTYLRDLDPYQEHYVKPPLQHIVIDFDLKDEHGNKSLELNLLAAADWPPTYAEVSKGGAGIHLHYNYDGDVSRLAAEFLPGIEIKVFAGNSSLRRRLSVCNDVSVGTISTGLPLKEIKRVLEPGTIQSAKGLRTLIERNLRKEIHPGTKPSIDFIHHILEEAYQDGLKYDVSDMYQRLFIFAQRSSNKSLECLKIVQNMRLKSEEEILDKPPPEPEEQRRVIFDIETYPNLFVICWKFEEDTPSKENVTVMINPAPHAVEALMRLKLVGFNVKKYDNHMLWGAALGLSNIELYKLSKRIIDNVPGSMFGEAHSISHADIWDFATNKQGLKKWQIQLGLEHREMDLSWDEPVPDDRVQDVVDYCINDVVSTEIVLKHLDGDYLARCILADLSGLPVNESTARHTAGIVFGRDKNPQKNFRYTKLAEQFPGYTYEAGKSYYRDELVGEGGYVYAEPGAYRNVALLDVASMHPTSIGELNLFGDYTPAYMAIVKAQLVVKNLVKKGNYDEASTLLDGKLASYVARIYSMVEAGQVKEATKYAADLRYGLKIAMNIVYGLTSAKFDNPFKDFRNVDNIVAKRGALFMIDLKGYVQDVLKLTVAHIKTDSIKVPDASPDDIVKIQEFAAKYGYEMEHEATYEKLALFNDAVYVARKDQCEITGASFDEDVKNKALCWTATGTQFIPGANPYVFKKLFGYTDSIGFNDVCVTKNVQQGALYLDFGNHYLIENPAGETVSDGAMGYVDAAVLGIKQAEKTLKAATKKSDFDGDPLTVAAAEEGLRAKAAYEEALKKLIFVGKVGRFTPVKEGYGGGQLLRVKDGKHYAVAGTKGYLWVDSNVAMGLPDEAIDYGYFDQLYQQAIEDIEKVLSNTHGHPFASVKEFLQ